jgi:hypothetical protein
MGTLTHLPIEEITIKYRLSSFIETGTYTGGGVNHAVSLNCFDLIQSVESSQNHHAFISTTPENVPIVLWRGFSETCLPGMLHLLGNSSCLFWLDAHLPTFYGDPSTHDLPLRNELDIIFDIRGKLALQDAFIIDDLRLFEGGNYQSGNVSKEVWDKLGVSPVPNDGWLDLFFLDHRVERRYEDEGYLIALPNSH